MKKIHLKLIASLLVIIILSSPVASMAITEVDNGNMQVYITSGGLEFDDLKGFDIKGYVTTNESTNEKELISSTFGDYGYHTFLNVNGISGEMDSVLTDEEDKTWEQKAQEMQYTALEGEGWQTINGIDLKVSTSFINDGEQLKITYTLKNTTSKPAVISLATASDVEIDNDDSATIDRLEDGSGVRLWTKKGNTKMPVQFVFYGKNVEDTTNIDNLWIGYWGRGENIKHMFVNNPDVNQIKGRDSSFAFSWVNKTIQANETQTYSVLMEVGEINIPNTGITLDNNTKFYYKDVKITGTVTDKDLKDKIIIHYTVDGKDYQSEPISTNGTVTNFTIDLTPLKLSAVVDHHIKVWATDSTDCESNTEERTFTITYLKEPVVTLSSADWSNDLNFIITDTENETQYVQKYQYRFNNGNWVDCSKDENIPVVENGITKIDVRIVGTFDGDFSNIVTVNAKLDKVNPTTDAPTATTTTKSITVTSHQTDEHSGIDSSKTMYSIEKDGVWSDWQESNIFDGLKHNTEYRIKTKSVDNAGNSSDSTESTVKTDELLVGNLILKLNNSEGADYTENTWTNQNIYVAVQETTDGATTTYKSKEDSAQNITETSQESTVTTDGTTIITLSVTDGVNTVTSNTEHILKVDKVAPVINQLVLDNDDWTKEVKNITGKAIDSLSGIVAYQFSATKDLTSSANGWLDVDLTNDEITQTKEIDENGIIYFYVKDSAGNVGCVGIDTKIDSQGPAITFSRSDGKTTINVTDTGAGVKSTKYVWTTSNSEPNVEDYKDYSEAVTYSGESKGEIYLWALSTDNLDNTTVSSSKFSELIKPTIVSEDSFVNKNISFKLTSETKDSDVLYQFKINDGEWENITKDSSHTITNIKNGEVTISARILDNAGRYSEVSTKTVKVSYNSTNSGNSGDGTTANGKLPQTGRNTTLIAISILALMVICIFVYRKLRLYKDIK